MPDFYNNRLLVYQMERLGLTPRTTAVRANIALSSVQLGLGGRLGTLQKLYKLAEALNVKWEYITRTDLPESQFRRAIHTGNGAMKKGG